MMMSDFPADLIVEILCRVPATSLKRLRSTCKQWNALFKDQRFSEKHFRKAPRESLYLMLKEYSLCSVRVDMNVNPPSIEFKGGVSLEDPHSVSKQVHIAQVFHCDGLLLCNTLDERLVVWNPCTGETRWIQPGHDNNIKKHPMLFAIGYKNEKSCRSYKILRRSRNPRVVASKIYDFSSNSWRVIEDMNTSCDLIANGGVSLKGNSYWIAYVYDKDYDVLICFDFTTERSKPLCLPQSHEKSFSRALSVVREEQLSVLSIIEAKMEIWVTTNKHIDTEADLSWSRFFAVDLLPRGKSVHVVLSFIIDEEKKLALSCICHGRYTGNLVWIIGGDDPYIETISCMDEKQWPWSTLYVPSLLQIQQKR